MGLFITFEGPEGSGKTTQIRRLADWLGDQGREVLTTREPGGTRIGEAIREVLLSPAHTEMCAEAEILLFSAARAQIVRETLQPHLARGGVVLCDRFADSTLAYQGYGRLLDLDTLRQITLFATGGLVPALTICLDLPVVEGLRRKQGGDQAEWNRMERERLDFQERVRRGYLALAAAEPQRWFVLDAQREIEVIQAEIRQRVAALLS
jgi:dTMP kinase